MIKTHTISYPNKDTTLLPTIPNKYGKIRSRFDFFHKIPYMPNSLISHLPVMDLFSISASFFRQNRASSIMRCICRKTAHNIPNDQNLNSFLLYKKNISLFKSI